MTNLTQSPNYITRDIGGARTSIEVIRKAILAANHLGLYNKEIYNVLFQKGKSFIARMIFREMDESRKKTILFPSDLDPPIHSPMSDKELIVELIKAGTFSEKDMFELSIELTFRGPEVSGPVPSEPDSSPENEHD